MKEDESAPFALRRSPVIDSSNTGQPWEKLGGSLSNGTAAMRF